MLSFEFLTGLISGAAVSFIWWFIVSIGQQEDYEAEYREFKRALEKAQNDNR